MNLEEMKRLAEAATPGPWELSHAGEGRAGKFTVTEYYVRMPDADFALAADIVDADMKPSEANAAFIAACSPSTILKLLEVVDKAQTYFNRYAQDEADDGQWLASNDDERGENTGCSRQQGIDALALRTSLQALKEGVERG